MVMALGWPCDCFAILHPQSNLKSIEYLKSLHIIVRFTRSVKRETKFLSDVLHLFSGTGLHIIKTSG